MIRRTLLRIARSGPGGGLVRLLLRRFPAAVLPLRRVSAPPGLLACHHPVPAYPVHILLIPLPPVARLEDVPAGDAGLFADVLRAASVVAERQGFASGWRLVVNGGRYQEVGVLHFHLIVP